MGLYDWLRSADEQTIFTAFDTETTGLDPKNNRVVEIGAIRFDSRGISARFSVLINPERPMPVEASRINGITNEMLADKPIGPDVFPDFLSFIGQSTLVAHNAPFDIKFINEELARLLLPPLANRVVDTRILAKEVFPRLPRYALQELAKHFGIEAKDAHRAEDDARVCLELFNVCRKNQSS
ncbi:MAG TPA: 3'-5' exonuclease [Treponema sp.]|nr:3'-5' exonuclease [Treponema sp.]